MRPSQSTNYNTNQTQQSTFDRIPPGFPAIPSSTRQQSPRLTLQNEASNNPNNTVQQSLNRLLQKPIVQQSPIVP
ncbi:unnamed protein product [Rotaria sp. Silwood2]|nr:unnamed protein product [Rotaria sp. Silwood2]